MLVEVWRSRKLVFPVVACAQLPWLIQMPPEEIAASSRSWSTHAPKKTKRTSPKSRLTELGSRVRVGVSCFRVLHSACQPFSRIDSKPPSPSGRSRNSSQIVISYPKQLNDYIRAMSRHSLDIFHPTPFKLDIIPKTFFVGTGHVPR